MTDTILDGNATMRSAPTSDVVRFRAVRPYVERADEILTSGWRCGAFPIEPPAPPLPTRQPISRCVKVSFGANMAPAKEHSYMVQALGAHRLHFSPALGRRGYDPLRSSFLAAQGRAGKAVASMSGALMPVRNKALRQVC